MKFTIEHELFSATTESLLVAERLIETIRVLESKPQKKVVAAQKDIFDTEKIDDVPEELLKPVAKPKCDPAWIEHPVDLRKQKIVRYSNPCSTLCGHNGGKAWQTELLIDTDGNLSACDCEFTDLEDLHNTLKAYAKPVNFGQETKTKQKPTCSMKRLQEVADLFNRGCDNKQVAEVLSLSRLSVSKYKNECKKAGLLK